jgi:SAM-dependent methyltransferase
MPNDEPEIQRLNEQHWILTQVKGGSLHFAPLPATKESPRILDIGCGSGIWCVEMAEDYPKAMIVGMDVSPVQPQQKPANVEWITQDMEAAWPFPEEYFDLIRLSLVHGCVADWPTFMTNLARYLAPGGWVEHQEFSLCRQYMVDEDGKPVPMSENPDELLPFFRWNRLMDQAALKRGRPLQLGPHLATFQRDAGLQNVREDVFAHKWGTWMSDPQERALGARTMLSTMSGMEGFTTALFTQALGWNLEDTRSFIVDIKRNMRDDSIRKVMDLHVVCGQKPGGTTKAMVPARRGDAEKIQYASLGTGVLLGAVAASLVSWWMRRR